MAITAMIERTARVGRSGRDFFRWDREGDGGVGGASGVVGGVVDGRSGAGVIASAANGAQLPAGRVVGYVNDRAIRIGDVAADPHSTIRDDLYPPPRFSKVRFARRSHVAGGGDLRNPHTQHAPGGAGGSRSDAYQDAVDAGLHQFQRCLVLDTIAGNHRNR